MFPPRVPFRDAVVPPAFCAVLLVVVGESGSPELIGSRLVVDCFRRDALRERRVDVLRVLKDVRRDLDEDIGAEPEA